MKISLLSLFLTFFLLQLNAQTEVEPNNTLTQATSITFNRPVKGAINPARDVDVYKFQVTEPGVVYVKVTNVPANIDMDYAFYGPNQASPYTASYGNGEAFTVIGLLCEPGTHYVSLGDDEGSAEQYTLLLEYDTSDIYECNNTLNSASSITIGDTVKASINSAGDIDFYKFQVTEPGVVYVKVTNVPANIDMDYAFYRTNQASPYTASYGNGEAFTVIGLLCEPGTYYVSLGDDEGSAEQYTLLLEYDTSDIYECNNTLNSASSITIGDTVKASINPANDIDFYKFQVTEPGTVYVKVNNVSANIDMDYAFYGPNQASPYTASYGNGEAFTVIGLLCEPGTYYVSLGDDEGSAEQYTLLLEYNTSDVYECNNDFPSATPINPCTPVKGAINSSGDRDIYKITVSNAGSYSVTVRDVPANLAIDIKVLNEFGAAVSTCTSAPTGVSAQCNFNISAAGVYFVEISEGSNRANSALYTMTFSSNLPCSPVAEICNNGQDDDGDGKIDCDDGDCANVTDCKTNPNVCETTNIVINSTVTAASCANTGSITVTATGGLAPYQYRWNTGQSTANLTNLGAGNYIVTVTDKNGCTQTKSVVVSKNDTTFLQLGLVAYYPFNGNAQDASGNGNNGTVNGAALTTDRFGVANKAYEFGVNRYIEVKHSNSITLRNQLTISAWVNVKSFGNPNSPSQLASILQKSGNQNHAGGDFSVTLNETGTTIGISTSNNFQPVSGRFNIAFNRWYHVLYTLEDNVLKVYVDKILLASKVVSGIIDNSQKSLFIGLDIDGSREWFNGTMDDIRIYNRALTECEVKDLYDREKPPVPACDSSLDNGLIAYYPFNGNAQDESGNGNNGTVNGAILTTDRYGNLNSAYTFDGIDDNIVVPDNEKLKPSKISISLWARQHDFDSYWRALVAKVQSDQVYNNNYIVATKEDRPIHAAINKGTNCFTSDDVVRHSNTFDWKLDNWEHICVTYDGNVLHFYQNGLLIDTTTFNFVANMNRCNDAPLTIGGTFYNTGNQHFTGEIDDVRLYNYSMTSQQVKDLYDCEKPGSDLCASFGFETSVDSIVVFPNSIETCNNQLYYVYPIGGKTPYQYKWSNGSTEQFIGGVEAGDYSVTVTDANNCSIDTTITVTLTELPVIAVNSKTSANCTAGGAVQIAVTKGVEPYAYRWSNGQTTANLSNLAAGTYTLTVSDANGCTDTETVVISLQVVTPSISNIQTNQATVNWSSVAGVSSYEVQYRKKGDTNWIVAGSIAGNSLVINNLQPQTDYEVQVIAKCSGTLSSTSVVVAFKTIGAATCNAPSLPIVQNLQTTGATVTWTAVANAVEYRVELKKEADANFRFYNATSSNSMVLSNLEANTRYQVRVKTVCNGSESQPSAVATFTTLPNNSTPNIPTDGLQLWLRGDAGVVLTNNLVGEWKDQSGNNRHAVQSAGDARPTLQNNALNGKPVVRFQAAGSGDGLSVAGMDLSNTSKVEIFVVYNNTNDPAFGGVTVLENTPNFNINPTGFGIFDNDDSCFDCKNGVNVGHRGNVGYHILNTPPLEAGYRMLNTMLDKSSTQEVALKINGEAPSDATFVFGSNNTNSFGNNTTYIGKRGAGNIENSAPMEGGIAEILVYNNLLNTADRTKVENYLCQKYNLPCKTDVCAGFQFGERPPVINSIQTCGNELYYVYPEGGLLPYSYQWSNGSQEDFIAGVPSGDYQVTVTDAAGCTIETTINVPVIEYPEVTVTSTTSGTCNNGGTVQISVVKGLAPYAYRWSNGQTTANLTDLGAGTYTVTVSDAKGCTATATATINLRTAVMESILSRSSQATFNWTGVAGATRYELQYRVRNTANWQTGGTVTTNSVTVTNLIPNTDYEARLITTCASGRSSTSSPVRFSTLPTGASGLQQVNFKDGVATAANINQFSIFPNPTSGNLTIQYQSSDETAWAWTISDATGRVVQKVQSPYASGNVTLDVSNLPSGLYWVSTVMNGQVLVEKVICE